MSFDATGIRFKLDNDLGGIGIFHEESICTKRDMGRVYGRATGTWVCVGAWVE